MRTWFMGALLALPVACDRPSNQLPPAPNAAGAQTGGATTSAAPRSSAPDPLAQLDAQIAELRTEAWADKAQEKLRAARPGLTTADMAAALKRERAVALYRLLKQAADTPLGRAKIIKLLRATSEPSERQALLEALRGRFTSLAEGQRAHVIREGLKGDDLALVTLADLLTDLKSERAFDAMLASDDLRIRKAGAAGLIAVASSLEAAVAAIVAIDDGLTMHDALPYGAALATRADEARPVAAKLLADPARAYAQIGLAFFLFAGGEGDRTMLRQYQSDSRTIAAYGCRSRQYRVTDKPGMGDLITIGEMVTHCAQRLLSEPRITNNRHHGEAYAHPAGSLVAAEIDQLLGDAPPAGILDGKALVGGPGVAGGSVSNTRTVMGKMRPGFRSCYQQGLAANPDMAGSVVIVARIGPEGNVQSVGGGGGGELAPIVPCLKGVVRRGTFAPPQGGAAVVSIPITFVKQ